MFAWRGQKKRIDGFREYLSIREGKLRSDVFHMLIYKCIPIIVSEVVSILVRIDLSAPILFRFCTPCVISVDIGIGNFAYKIN